MGKKKNRSNTNNNNNCVQNSSDSVRNIVSSETKCQHISRSISLSTVRKTLKKDGISNKCSRCHNLLSNSQLNNNNNTNSDNNKLSLLVCLQCGNESCGESFQNHAKEHYEIPHSDWHYLAVNLLDWKIHCYKCKVFIDIDINPQLHDIIELLKGLTPKLCSRNNSIPKPNEKKPKENGLISQTDTKKDEIFQSFPVKGLSNLGNTCFFNSVLQCFAQTPYLVEVLEDLINPRNVCSLPGGELKISFNDDENDTRTHTLPPIEKTLDSSGNFTAVFYKTLIDMRNPSSNEIYKPSLLLNSLKKKISHCTDGGQHDSHELLRLLLELIRNEHLQRYQSIILKEIGVDNETKQSKDLKNKAYAKFYESQANSRLLGVESLFRGILESTVECTECGNSSRCNEHFMDLSLPVVLEKSQQFSVKQRNETLDTMSNDYFSTDRKSKHQLKKEKKMAKLNRRSNKKFHNQKIRNDYEDKNNVPDLKIEILDAENQAHQNETDKVIETENSKDVSKDIFENRINSNSTIGSELRKTDISNKLYSEAVNQDDPLSLEIEHTSHNRLPLINNSNNSNELTTKLSNMSINRDKLSQAFTHNKSPDNKISIQCCLNQFTAVELLDDNNKVHCKVCTDRINKAKCEKVSNSKSVYTSSMKQYLISQAPAILILHLKRFQSQRFNGYHKTDKHVSFPLQLDLTPFCKNIKKKKLYSLYGLIEHSGTIHGGHYVAYVKARRKLNPNDSRWSFLLKNDVSKTENDENYKNADENIIIEEKNDYMIPGQWFYASDSRVSKIDEATVLKKQAYLLFYERVLWYKIQLFVFTYYVISNK